MKKPTAAKKTATKTVNATELATIKGGWAFYVSSTGNDGLSRDKPISGR